MRIRFLCWLKSNTSSLYTINSLTWSIGTHHTGGFWRSQGWCWEKRFPLAHFADKSAFFLCLPCPVPVMREAVGKSVPQWRCAPRWAVRTQTYPWAPSQSQTQSQTSHKPSHKPVTNSVTNSFIAVSYTHLTLPTKA